MVIIPVDEANVEANTWRLMGLSQFQTPKSLNPKTPNPKP